MRVAVVAFPRLDDAERLWIESLRSKHDPQAHRVAAHLTLVFPVEARPETVQAEVASLTRSTRPIPISFRRVRVMADAFGHGYHVCLVPDDGAARISTLHDRLYAGALSGDLRSDVTFVPHMTVGTAPDSTTAKTMAREFDLHGRTIRGTIEALEVVEVSEARVQCVAAYVLESGVRRQVGGAA